MDHDRAQFWQMRLARFGIRLHPSAEPVADQLDRLRRVTVVLTLIPALIAALFLAIFTRFGRPDVGTYLVAVVLGPVVALAWFDFARTRAVARNYLRERDAAPRD